MMDNISVWGIPSSVGLLVHTQISLNTINVGGYSDIFYRHTEAKHFWGKISNVP